METNPADRDSVFFKCAEGSAEAIMITDKDGLLIYVNPAWSRIYGYASSEAIGRTPRILHSGRQSQKYYELMWQAILDPQKGVWKGELVNRAKNGTLIPVQLTISPYRDSHGEIQGHMSIAIDLRSRRKLEAQILRQDRLASLGLLMSGIAHEIGTPLATLRGRAEMLLMKSSNNVEQSRTLEIILEQVDRVSRLVEGLLRLGRGKGDFKPQRVAIFEAVSQVLDLIHHSFEKAKVEIIVDIPRDTHAWIDADRFQQILLNLLVNALHAIEEVKDVSSDRERRVEITSKQDERSVQIFVKDTGCGISHENLERIFDPFFTTKGVGKGTGLGLAIVAKLLHEMGCHVDVSSALDAGTVFHLTLPVSLSNSPIESA